MVNQREKTFTQCTQYEMTISNDSFNKNNFKIVYKIIQEKEQKTRTNRINARGFFCPCVGIVYKQNVKQYVVCAVYYESQEADRGIKNVIELKGACSLDYTMKTTFLFGFLRS